MGNNYKLREISIDGNPISSTTRFKNQLILSIPRLETLDEDKIGDLDREVANQYFEMHGLEKPQLPKNKGIMKQVNFDGGKEGFKAQGKSRDIDDDHEGDW